MKILSTITLMLITLVFIACKEQSEDKSQKNTVNEKSTKGYSYEESELPYISQIDCGDIDGLSLFEEEVPDDYEGFLVGECMNRGHGDKIWRLAYSSISNGKKHVVYHGWRNENQLYEERIIVSDTLRSYRIWFENGQLAYHKTTGYTEDADTVRNWNEAGQISLENIIHKSKAGSLKIWHPNGQLGIEEKYNEKGEILQLSGWSNEGEKIKDVQAHKTNELNRVEGIFWSASYGEVESGPEKEQNN